MDTAIQDKNERINLRLKSSAKRLIDLAAGFEGKTVSHFILTSALKHAAQTVQEHQRMILNGADASNFFDALAKPVVFNQKLTAAFEEHDKRVISR